jgi:hypothetical protein
MSAGIQRRCVVSRPPKKRLSVNTPLNFLLGCSETTLASFELAKLNEVANLRQELHLILDRVIDEMSQAAVAAWFRQTDVATLKRALENPEDVLLWAQEQIRDGQRSERELVPRASLPPGKAHLAAALRYAERNIAGGKCAVCPEPLDRNSVRYCRRHLLIARLRKPPKGAKGALPGSIDWLYGDGVFESAHGKAGRKALEELNEKRKRGKS